jgi:hypothetical protein
VNKGPNRGRFKGYSPKTEELQYFVDALRVYMGKSPLYRDPLPDEEVRFYAAPPDWKLPAAPTRLPDSV